jgi:hypothetical protein
MEDLTRTQIAVLERMIERGFTPVAFPLYAAMVGVRKQACAALLEPVVGGGFRVYGQPCVLIDGNLTVRIADAGKSWFVWKKLRVEATAERVAELEGFVGELKLLLEPHL